MLKTVLPRRRFNVTDYPNLDPDSIGNFIPIGYGTLTGLIPTEIDTTAGTWKILDQSIAELTAIRSATKNPLIHDVDYTDDLALAEFTLLKPVYLSGLETYYFAVEADYTESGTNYIELSRNVTYYAYGTSYTIDSWDSWTPDADDYDLMFVVYGKTSVTATAEVIATNTTPDATPKIGLKDAEARTKIGQSFMPSASAFATKITLYVTRNGTLTGKNIRVMLYSDTAGTQIGPSGTWLPIGTGGGGLSPVFAERQEDEDLTCDVKAPGTELTKVADILPDVMTNIMGKSSALLDATELANLDTHKTEDLEIYLNDGIEFGEFAAKLEAGQMWKLVPLQDGSYGTIVPQAGDPGPAPHFYDHDFLSFKMILDQDKIKHTVDVAYNEDPLGDFRYASASSDVAKFFYMNEESMAVETYLKTMANADALAAAYRDRYEVPVATAVFEVHGWGLDLLPFRDKVRLTRTRAAYRGGTSIPALWPHRKRIDLPIPTANLTDFPVEVPIIADAAIGAKCLASGYDLRFTAADGTTLLPYERESFAVAGGEATGIFWVKTDVAMAGTYIWCFYGNPDATDGATPEDVWDANFAAVYHMNDATTSTILDSTGNDNDGTKKGANEPIEAAGKVGKGQDFDGSDDYISAPDSPSLNPTTALTIEAWVKTTGNAESDGRVISKREGGVGAYEIYIQTSSGTVEVYIDTGAGDLLGYGIAVYTDGLYHHACLIRDGEDWILYFDGAYDNGGDSGPTGSVENGNDLIIGRYCPAEIRYFDGIIDEVRISSIARSAEWIAYEYANMNPADGGLTWGAEEALGGMLDGILFRVTKLVKRPGDNVVEITASVWAGAAT